MPNPEIKIALPELSSTEVALVRRYLTESHRFSGIEWQTLRRTLAKLEQAIVQFGAQTYRFSQFYRTFINGTYAYPFLTTLAKVENLEQDGPKVQAAVARQIWQWLETSGIRVAQVPHAQYLVVYCLAQWGAFARGHLFETAILRELAQAGITIRPHDPITERFAPHDVYIPGLGYGDIKTSGYFLDDLVLETPATDFYVTRSYAPPIGQYVYVVFLTLLAWKRLPASHAHPTLPVVEHLDTAVAYFPQPVRVRIESVAWIMVEYKQWLTWVRQAQKELGNHG